VPSGRREATTGLEVRNHVSSHAENVVNFRFYIEGQKGPNKGHPRTTCRCRVATEDGRLAASNIRPPQPMNGPNRNAVETATTGIIEAHGPVSGVRRTDLESTVRNWDRISRLRTLVSDYESRKGKGVGSRILHCHISYYRLPTHFLTPRDPWRGKTWSSTFRAGPRRSRAEVHVVDTRKVKQW
jgi:hypothetical protein